MNIPKGRTLPAGEARYSLTPKEKAINSLYKKGLWTTWDIQLLDKEQVNEVIDIALQEQAKEILGRLGRIADWNEPQQIEIDKVWKEYLHNPVIKQGKEDE